MGAMWSALLIDIHRSIWFDRTYIIKKRQPSIPSVQILKREEDEEQEIQEVVEGTRRTSSFG